MKIELCGFYRLPFLSVEQRRLSFLHLVHALCLSWSFTEDVAVRSTVCELCQHPQAQSLSRQRLSYWIVEAFSPAYRSISLPLPQAERANSSWSVAASWTSLKMDLCSAACWSSLHTSVRFYHLDGAPRLVEERLTNVGTTVVRLKAWLEMFSARIPVSYSMCTSFLSSREL